MAFKTANDKLQKFKNKEKAHLKTRWAYLGAINGARTHDNRNHNPGLYQLSYDRRNYLFEISRIAQSQT